MNLYNIAKHLCGGATDLSLNAMLKPDFEK
jgi:hypothetical protein